MTDINVIDKNNVASVLNFSLWNQTTKYFNMNGNEIACCTGSDWSHGSHIAIFYNREETMP